MSINLGPTVAQPANGIHQWRPLSLINEMIRGGDFRWTEWPRVSRTYAVQYCTVDHAGYMFGPRNRGPIMSQLWDPGPGTFFEE
jgi:hypothetical protein